MKLKQLLFMVFLLHLYACKRDINILIPNVEPFDVDPTKLSQTIYFEEQWGITINRVEGDFSQNQMVNSIKLISPIAKQSTVLEDVIVLPLKSFDFKKIKGIYLKVNGASDYFDIQNGFYWSKDDSLDFYNLILKNEGILTYNGKFKLSYCAYDENNKISNIVSIDYNVVDYPYNLPNSQKSLLDGNWQLYKKETYDNFSKRWITSTFPSESNHTDTIFDCFNPFNVIYPLSTFKSDNLIQFDHAFMHDIQKDEKNFVNIPNNTCVVGLNNIQGEHIKTTNDFIYEYAYDEVNNRLFLFNSKFNQLILNGEDNAVISDFSKDFPHFVNQPSFTFDKAPIVYSTSPSEIRLEYTDYFGFVYLKQYLRKM